MIEIKKPSCDLHLRTAALCARWGLGVAAWSALFGCSGQGQDANGMSSPSSGGTSSVTPSDPSDPSIPSDPTSPTDPSVPDPTDPTDPPTPSGGACDPACDASETCEDGTCVEAPPCEGDNCEWSPVPCTSPFFDAADFTSLPQIRTKPDAGVVFYLDFDGGTYDDDAEYLSPYYTGTTEQRENIVKSFNYMIQYFGMFDIALTTRAEDVGSGSDADGWGWIVISPDVSGGRGGVGVVDNRESNAHARAGTSTLTGSDRSRRIAHELGHNIGLDHNGVGGEKFEDWSGWDGEFGSVMGGGGEGVRNGWVTASTGSETQDSLEVIRELIADLDDDTPNNGWAEDDFPETAPLCAGETPYRIGVLGHVGDVDTFAFSWDGGDIEIDANPTEVSAALLSLTISRDGQTVGSNSVMDAPAGVYEVSVESAGTFEIMESQSVGTYEAIGYYELYLR